MPYVDFENMPREFEEHRYFCSLGVKVPTEKHEFVLDRMAMDIERKIYSLMRREALRRRLLPSYGMDGWIWDLRVDGWI